MNNLSLSLPGELLRLAGQFIVNQLSAQTPASVSGRVTEEIRQVLPGVTLLIKGTTKPVEKKTTLVTSYVGYLNQEIPISNGTGHRDSSFFKNIIQGNKVPVKWGLSLR